jgi:hypothetical protein
MWYVFGFAALLLRGLKLTEDFVAFEFRAKFTVMYRLKELHTVGAAHKSRPIKHSWANDGPEVRTPQPPQWKHEEEKCHEVLIWRIKVPWQYACGAVLE